MMARPDQKIIEGFKRRARKEPGKRSHAHDLRLAPQRPYKETCACTRASRWGGEMSFITDDQSFFATSNVDMATPTCLAEKYCRFLRKGQAQLENNGFPASAARLRLLAKGPGLVNINGQLYQKSLLRQVIPEDAKEVVVAQSRSVVGYDNLLIGGKRGTWAAGVAPYRKGARRRTERYVSLDDLKGCRR
jgi:hypothetical protein